MPLIEALYSLDEVHFIIRLRLFLLLFTIEDS